MTPDEIAEEKIKRFPGHAFRKDVIAATEANIRAKSEDHMSEVTERLMYVWERFPDQSLLDLVSKLEKSLLFSRGHVVLGLDEILTGEQTHKEDQACWYPSDMQLLAAMDVYVKHEGSLESLNDQLVFGNDRSKLDALRDKIELARHSLEGYILSHTIAELAECRDWPDY